MGFWKMTAAVAVGTLAAWSVALSVTMLFNNINEVLAYVA